MQVNMNTPNFGAKIKIDAFKNTDKPLLYNEILAIVKENKLTTIFNSSYIKIDIPQDCTRANSSVQKALSEAGISFDTIG